MNDSTHAASVQSTQDVSSLLVVSHVRHYRHAGRLYAYGPYVREIDMWAELFPEVRIAAPCREEEPPGVALPFVRTNVDIVPQRETGGDTLAAKAVQVLMLPILVWDLARAMRAADAIHVRCPGNLGLLGVLLAPLFTPYRVAKYAGQWSGFPGEAATVRLQRALLRSSWWDAPVTVYGERPGDPAHVVPFFTSILTDTQMDRARRAACRTREHTDVRVLFVGRLSGAKNVRHLVSALEGLVTEGLSMTCDIVGDGPRREALEEQVGAAGLRDRVHFAGSIAFEEVLGYYERADVLVLASETEGWPKAIAEGMAFGLVCIGSARGLVPWMLADGRGIVVPPGDPEALGGALRRVAQHPGGWAEMRARAAAWGQRHSLEHLRTALRGLLEERWGVSLRAAQSI